jgi:hypothetical protein
VNVTYVVTIDMPDPAFAEDIALEIDDTLTDSGFNVISVIPPSLPEPELPPLF